MCTKYFKVAMENNPQEYSITLIPDDLMYIKNASYKEGFVSKDKDLMDIYNNNGGKDMWGDVWTVIEGE